ncbi:MAG: phage holin family protein [Chloroflexota bacterium]
MNPPAPVPPATPVPPAAPAPTGRVTGSAIDRVLRVWRDEYDTAANWPKGKRHLVRRALVITVTDTIALIVAAWLLPGVRIDSISAALMVTIIAGLLTFTLRPIAFLVVRQGIILTAFLTILLMGFTLLVAQYLVDGVTIDGWTWAFVTALVVAAVNTVLIGLLGLDEDESFYRNTLKKLARARGDVDDRPGPGFVIIQVDGLAEPVIRHALRTGYMPFLSAAIRDGTHRLGRWEALAPSMTSAGQTGILHGNNAEIPAFRWWEKDRRYLMVSNHPDDAWLIEQRASGPNDLLRDGGASISNLVSGGAPRSIATNSQLSGKGQGIQMDGFSLYLVNPYNVTRGALQFLWLVVLEWFQARNQRQRGVEPRIARNMPFPMLRASTATIMRDMLTDLVIGEMYRGTPVIYADYLGYDEVAHHAGPERPEAMEELIKVDRQVRTIARAVEGAPRRYHLVLVSDHGQSQGAPFSDRYGMTLEELVKRLAEGSPDVLAATEDAESWGPLNAFATEILRSKGRTAKVARRALRERTTDGVVELGRSSEARHIEEQQAATAGAADAPEIIVAASGNLANIYLTGEDGRVSLERMAELHPGLVAGLVLHPGIGFVLVRSEEHGALAIGRQGVHLLDERRVVGEDPLEPFGKHAADNLRRLDSFQHVGDLLVNSIYDPASEEIAPFEHQVGAHGGLGGAQTKAFLYYPTELEPSEDPVSLVGAEAVNAKIREWMARARDQEARPAVEAASRSLAPEVAAVLKRDGDGAAVRGMAKAIAASDDAVAAEAVHTSAAVDEAG